MDLQLHFTITSFLRVIHYDSLLIYDCLLFWYKNQRQDEQFLSSLKRNLLTLINEEEQDRLDSNQDADSTLLANNKNMSMKESSISESAAFFALGSGLITDVFLQFIIEGNAPTLTYDISLTSTLYIRVVSIPYLEV